MLIGAKLCYFVHMGVEVCWCVLFGDTLCYLVKHGVARYNVVRGGANLRYLVMSGVFGVPWCYCVIRGVVW